MQRVNQYHSARHEPDNKYHIYTDCHLGMNIEYVCIRASCRPKDLCVYCGG